MKKVIILAVMFIPLTALGQSREDRLVGTYGFKVQPVKVDTTAIQKHIERKIFRQLELNARYKKIPLIEDDRVVRAKALTKKHCTDNKCTFKQVLKAVFLGGKFPWETDDQYRIRKQIECSPAGQPFK